MEAEQEQAARNPWDQMPGEPDRWYGRFKVYLELGPARTLHSAARMICERNKKPAYDYSGGWSINSRKWHWRQRANAWDVRQRELLAISERNLRLALRG